MEQDAILRSRTQIFDSLSNMSELKQSQRIVVVRNEFEPCLKLAAQSSRHCKLACAYLLELQNRLKLVDMKTPSLAIKMSAVDSSLSRNANYLGINLANRTGRMAQKRKANNTLVSKKKRRACRTCRDVFKEKPGIYLGHRSGSSKCPNATRKVSEMSKPQQLLETNNLGTIDEGLPLECTDPTSQSELKPPPHDSEKESIYEMNNTDVLAKSEQKPLAHDSLNESIRDSNDRKEVQLILPGVPLQLQSPVSDSSLGSISDDSVVARAREYLTQKSNDTDDSVHHPVFKSVSFFQLTIIVLLYVITNTLLWYIVQAYMNENELSSYRSELEQWADQKIPASMPYIVLLQSIGWKMVDSGLLPKDEDPCYRQKMDVYGEFLVARKSKHKNVTFDFV